MEYSERLSGGFHVKMLWGAGVPATTSTDTERLEKKAEAGSGSKIASSGVSLDRREKGGGGVDMEVWKV